MNEKFGPERLSNLPASTWPNALVHPPLLSVTSCTLGPTVLRPLPGTETQAAGTREDAHSCLQTKTKTKTTEAGKA